MGKKPGMCVIKSNSFTILFFFLQAGRKAPHKNLDGDRQNKHIVQFTSTHPTMMKSQKLVVVTDPPHKINWLQRNNTKIRVFGVSPCSLTCESINY